MRISASIDIETQTETFKPQTCDVGPRILFKSKIQNVNFNGFVTASMQNYSVDTHIYSAISKHCM
jgi:hypothetical protein